MRMTNLAVRPQSTTPLAPSSCWRRHACALPSDAQAVITPGQPAVTTAGRAETMGWMLTFAPRTPSAPEPLMGWNGGTDTVQQVRMRFPSAEAAMRYCERQGIAYELLGVGAGPVAAERYSPANDAAALDERRRLSPAAVYSSPEAVLEDDSLSSQAKREVLQRWAWDEYLLELEAAEGPVGDHVSRLAEVRAALTRLDGAPAEADAYRWEPAAAA